jgi:sugar lactone lactonase YvrE
MNGRHRWMAGALCSAGVLLLARGSSADGAQRPPSLAFERVQAFESGASGPESVTTDAQGNLYLSVGQQIMRRSPEGAVAIIATLPLPIFALGVKVGPDGCVYNASSSLSEVAGAFVWRTCQPDAAAPDVIEVVAELDPAGLPNDLAFDGDGSLFVTDPGLGRIWQLDPGASPRVFVEHPLLAGVPEAPALLFHALGANGIAFDACERFLYVSNTDQGSIVRLDRDRPSAEPELVAQAPALRGADGIAFDRRGTLYVAVNASDTLVALSARGELTTLSQGGLLDAPSSLVFGAGAGDRHRLYLTSSAFSRTLGLQPGTPQPALLVGEFRRRTPGEPLPLP